MDKKLKRIIPLDVLNSDEFIELIGDYKQSAEGDPVHPLTFSPQPIITPTERFRSTALPAAAVVTATTVGVAKSTISWTWIALGIAVLLLVLFLYNYWAMAQKLGWSYAIAAACPPMRLVIAPMISKNSEQMLTEIEAFNFGLPPLTSVPPPPPPSPSPKPQPQKLDDKQRQELIDEYLRQADLQGSVPVSNRKDGVLLQHNVQPENRETHSSEVSVDARSPAPRLPLDLSDI